MLNVYYSNQLAINKDHLISFLKEPNPDPFTNEIVLVQSTGMAKWLQMEIASELGISGGFEFSYPTNFIWQQYRNVLGNLPEENIFARHKIVWRLMRLIPIKLSEPDFSTLKEYLNGADTLKLYQLALKIADLFDQYLVYRPEWLEFWEQGKDEEILKKLLSSFSFKHKNSEELARIIRWQGILWKELREDIKKDTKEDIINTSHRAKLQEAFIKALPHKSTKLPKRFFIFGISSLPKSQLDVICLLSHYCDVHLFFTNPSQEYWGLRQDQAILEKLALKQKIELEEIDKYMQGNPLLAIWGNQGREFFNLLEEKLQSENEHYFDEFDTQSSLLASVKRAILFDCPELDYQTVEDDRSIQIHACHSKMREVEVLHNHLLEMFETNADLQPKDIIVMSPDIDSYSPYINAVFSRYYSANPDFQDPRFIPFSLSDQKISQIEPVVASFLSLLSFKEKVFSVEEVFDLLNVAEIRNRYHISEIQLATLREWVQKAGIRAGLNPQNKQWENYNSWENGMARLLLGTALKEENNAWQGVLAFDESYGLEADLCGNFANFLENLINWYQLLQKEQSPAEWQAALINLLHTFYDDNGQNSILLNLHNTVVELFKQIEQSNFAENIPSEILLQSFETLFEDSRNNMNFMVGKVNFCTLMPMRAIPFKVVCLLGMNEGEFPRQQIQNNFDLMQYDHQKGDRAKRDDDRYLFLESLLSAQQIFYISYVGQSLTDNREKLPSILVSQLKDYLAEQLEEAEILDTIIKNHPMTVFSPNNFINGAISYDKEWLKSQEPQTISAFITTLVREEQDLPNEVELSELVEYLQDPTQFFFQQHLGVRFKQNNENLGAHEVFELSNLDRYKLRDELITVEENEQADFFHKAKLKGLLPNGYFGKLTEEDLINQISGLRSELKSYLKKEKSLLEINHQFTLFENSKKILVQGYIQNYFADEQCIVQWRAGSLRDKDRIQTWVYHLFLTATQEQPIKYRFYYVENAKAGYLEFNAIEKSEAEQLLTLYLHDFFANYSQLTPALTYNLKSFFKAVKDEKIEPEQIKKWLINEDRFSNKKPHIYWKRVLSQQTNFNFDDIQRRTERWFDKMIDTKVEEKL